MSLRKLVLLAAAILAVASCKDDEQEALPPLEGLVAFYTPDFIEPGQTITMTPKGVEHPDDKGFGYFWVVSPGDIRDTTKYENGLTHNGKPSDGSYTFRFPDDLTTYTFTCYAFAKGYSGVSGSRSVTVVKGGINGSLTGTELIPTDDHITVDGDDYYYVRIGNLDWFRNNLAINKGGAAYANVDIMSDVLGRFYSYEDALTACPDGWRLPTEDDWLALGEELGSEGKKYGRIPDVASKLMVDVSFNGMKMWEYWPSAGKITNDSRLAIIPSGYTNLEEKAEDGSYPHAVFTGEYKYSAHWTADIAEDGLAYYRYIYCKLPDMFIGKADTKTFGAAVRCVRNTENQTL